MLNNSFENIISRATKPPFFLILHIKTIVIISGIVLHLELL